MLMDPRLFAGGAAPFLPEVYFAGRTRAWGLFQDRFGAIRRRFAVDIRGVWTGSGADGTLTLEEDFLYDDGETERRIWTIRKLDERRYEGSAADVVGLAHGEVEGGRLLWRYDFALKLGSRRLVVRFDDLMLRQDEAVMLNRARISKLGITLGHVFLCFHKCLPGEPFRA